MNKLMKLGNGVWARPEEVRSITTYSATKLDDKVISRASVRMLLSYTDKDNASRGWEFNEYKEALVYADKIASTVNEHIHNNTPPTRCEIDTVPDTTEYILGIHKSEPDEVTHLHRYRDSRQVWVWADHEGRLHLPTHWYPAPDRFKNT